MSEQEIITALAVAAPVGLIIYLIVWRVTATLPTIIEKWTKHLEEKNRGEKERAEIVAQAQTEMVRAAAVMVDKSALAVKEYQSDSRAFWSGRVEEMRQEMKGLEHRVLELEAQVDDKDKRIEELERENERLHSEVDTLRTRLDKTQERKPATKKRAA